MTSKISRPTDITEAEIDDLLSKLTQQEIDELCNDYDPDNTLLPPSERCRNQTDKQPTGPFDRDHLMNFLEEKARAEKDWDRNQPFVHEIRGKVFVKKQPMYDSSAKEMEAMGFEPELEDDITEALNNATEEEMVDLAALLGFNAALTQEQVHASTLNKEQLFGGFGAVTKAEKLKVMPMEEPNDTDVENSIQRLLDNDADLTDLNLNNIKTISRDEFKRLCTALRSNTHLKTFFCANTSLTNAYCEAVVDMLNGNSTLKYLNLESNFFTGESILKIVKAAGNENSGLTDLLLRNQRQASLGVNIEMKLTELVLANPRFLKLEVDVDTANARARIISHILENNDAKFRQTRWQ